MSPNKLQNLRVKRPKILLDLAIGKNRAKALVQLMDINDELE